MDQLGLTRTKNAANVAKYKAKYPEKEVAMHAIQNPKRVYIAGKYVLAETTLGIPGGRYKTWGDAHAAAATPSLMKKCGKCRFWFARSKFGPNKSTPDGLAGYCRACAAEQHRENHPKSNPWRLLPNDRAVPMADRPVGWQRAKNKAEAHAMMIQKQVTGSDGLSAYDGARDIVTRSARRDADGDAEIQHPELDRIRGETIRRYAAADRAHDAARDGFVYVMAHTIYSPGIVKVGHSRDPYKRASQANTNSAEGKHTIKYMKFFKDRALAESLVHSLLWHHRVQGEHFCVSVGDAIVAIAGVDL